MPIPSILSLPSNLFSLHIEHFKTYTKIDMQIFSPAVNTRDLPLTTRILKENLPSVLRSECFNDSNIPFAQEVKTTEVGHLFEHILLEYLCLQKMTVGCKTATFNGVTNWNWKKDTWGMFHIIVSAGYKDLPIFARALQKTTNLMNVILQQERQAQYAPIHPTATLSIAS